MRSVCDVLYDLVYDAKATHDLVYGFYPKLVACICIYTFNSILVVLWPRRGWPRCASTPAIEQSHLLQIACIIKVSNFNDWAFPNSLHAHYPVPNMGYYMKLITVHFWRFCLSHQNTAPWHGLNFVPGALNKTALEGKCLFQVRYVCAAFDSNLHFNVKSQYEIITEQCQGFRPVRSRSHVPHKEETNWSRPTSIKQISYQITSCNRHILRGKETNNRIWSRPTSSLLIFDLSTIYS